MRKRQESYSAAGTAIGLACVGISLAACVAVVMVVVEGVFTLVEQVGKVIA